MNKKDDHKKARIKTDKIIIGLLLISTLFFSLNLMAISYESINLKSNQSQKLTIDSLIQKMSNSLQGSGMYVEINNSIWYNFFFDKSEISIIRDNFHTKNLYFGLHIKNNITFFSFLDHLYYLTPDHNPYNVTWLEIELYFSIIPFISISPFNNSNYDRDLLNIYLQSNSTELLFVFSINLENYTTIDEGLKT